MKNVILLNTANLLTHCRGWGSMCFCILIKLYSQSFCVILNVSLIFVQQSSD